MLSFLGGKPHGAFGQPLFSLAGNRMTTVFFFILFLVFSLFFFGNYFKK